MDKSSAHYSTIRMDSTFDRRKYKDNFASSIGGPKTYRWESSNGLIILTERPSHSSMEAYTKDSMGQDRRAISLSTDDSKPVSTCIESQHPTDVDAALERIYRCLDMMGNSPLVGKLRERTTEISMYAAATAAAAARIERSFKGLLDTQVDLQEWQKLQRDNKTYIDKIAQMIETLGDTIQIGDSWPILCLARAYAVNRNYVTDDHLAGLVKSTILKRGT